MLRWAQWGTLQTGLRTRRSHTVVHGPPVVQGPPVILPMYMADSLQWEGETQPTFVSMYLVFRVV